MVEMNQSVVDKINWAVGCFFDHYNYISIFARTQLSARKLNLFIMELHF